MPWIDYEKGKGLIVTFLHPQVRKKLLALKEVLCYEDQNPNVKKGECVARVVIHPQTSELAKILLHLLGKI